MHRSCTSSPALPLAILPAIAAFAACAGVPPIRPAPAPVVEPDPSVDALRAPGIEPSWIDPTVSPGDDFYLFACGGWLKGVTLPEGAKSFGGFDVADASIEQDLEALLQGAHDDRDPLGELGRTLYRSGLDGHAIEASGLDPLALELRQIAEMDDLEACSRAIAHLQLIGVTPFFRIHRPVYWEVLDENYLYLRQTSLGLADGMVLGRELDGELLLALRTYVATLLERLGHGAVEAAELAEGILALEQRLAARAMPASELRDFRANYNPLSPGNLEQLTGSFRWSAFFKGLGIEKPSRVIVGQPAFFEEIGQILDEPEWDLLRAYFQWALLSEFAPELGPHFAEPRAAFHARVRGTSTEPSREKQMTRVVMHELPDVLGTMYLEECFPRSSHDRVLAMTANLRAAFDARIRSSSWLQEDTRAHALAKLAAMRFVIGGPQPPDYYDGLQLDAGTFISNLLATRRHRMVEHLRHTDKPWVDDGWRIESWESNAWYQPSRNAIVLSAAGINELLRPEADDAYHYGALGSRIAHEMMHAFDELGRLYDEQCRRRDWWSRDDEAAVAEIGASLAVFYEELGERHGLPVDGNRTLGENLGDVVGLRVAHDAYQLSRPSAEGVTKLGYDDLQRFFLAYAQKWREQLSSEAMQVRLQGWHSPPQLRANGPTALCPAFQVAFPEASPGALAVEPGQQIPVW